MNTSIELNTLNGKYGVYIQYCLARGYEGQMSVIYCTVYHQHIYFILSRSIPGDGRLMSMLAH